MYCSVINCWAKDGLGNVMGSPGLILRNRQVDGLWICLDNRTWATMAWPLLEVSDRCYRLDTTPDVEAAVLFLYDHSDWEASTSTAVWVEDVGVCLKQACFEPLPKAAMRDVTSFTFVQLVTLATCLGMAGAEKLSRPDLVTRICQLFDDEAFTEYVKSEEAKSGKVKEVSLDPLLASELLNQLDKDEAQEFQDIKKKLCPKVAVKRKWKDMYNDEKTKKAAKAGMDVFVTSAFLTYAFVTSAFLTYASVTSAFLTYAFVTSSFLTFAQCIFDVFLFQVLQS